jgi:hypothetical protein
MAAFLSWLPTLLRRLKRDALLAAAASWPTTTAKLLKSTVVAKDLLAEGGTAFQESQVESQFYFTLPAGYFGGHLRSTPVSDSEGHRLLRALPEDLEVTVRYNPANPDQTVALAEDNRAFPVTLWPPV